MTPILWVVLMLTVVAVIYGLTAFGYFFAARPGMGLAFVGYVIANIGLIWDALKA